MNGVIYARYSSDNQREESIEGQIRECKEYAKQHDINIINEYIDRARSATNDKRPAFQQMISDSENGVFDAVIVWKTDRFSRNRKDSLIYRAKLKDNGVDLISIKEDFGNGTSKILLESFIESMAEYYSADLSEKVKRGHTENALKCKNNGGTKPLGYKVNDNGDYETDSLTAPFVLKSFEMYSTGSSITEIVDFLCENNVKNTLGRNMNIDSVKRMLHNAKYKGDYVYAEHNTPGGMPAIVTPELFNAVQERMATNHKTPTEKKPINEYLLTTKLFCGLCGETMVGESGTSHTKTVHQYYKCTGAKKHSGCTKKTVKKDWIEGIVFNYIKKIIYNDKLLKEIADEVMKLHEDDDRTLKLLNRQLADTEKGIKNVLDGIQRGGFSESLNERLGTLEKAKKEILVQIAKEKSSTVTVSKDGILEWLKKLRNLDDNNFKNKRRLIHIFINKIVLFDDRIIITFNFRNNSKTVRFNNVLSAEKSKKGSSTNAFGAPFRVFIQYLNGHPFRFSV